jgi:chemotaxis protein CheD
VFASREPAEATTILGSCVAVCLWDRPQRLGGANHFLLPHGTDCGNNAARFGNVAVDRLIAELVGLGSRKAHLQAKIFGGAAVIEAFRGGEEHLGAKNVSVARDLLRRQGIPIVAEDVGGHRGRKVIFHTDSGIALVRLI